MKSGPTLCQSQAALGILFLCGFLLANRWSVFLPSIHELPKWLAPDLLPCPLDRPVCWRRYPRLRTAYLKIW
jgi:hypothetical protein